MQKLIQELITAALAAVDPFTAVQNHLQLDGDRLIIGNRIIDLTNQDLRCISVGKAEIGRAHV